MLAALRSVAPAVETLVAGAAAALGAFFAISGFVLTLRYRQTEWNRTALLRYGIARFARIYPLYILSLLILAPIIAGSVERGEVGSPAQLKELVAKYLLLLQGWERLPVDWNTPAWSLSCEVFFYAMFPVMAVLLRGRLRPTAVAGTLLFSLAFPLAYRLLELPLAWKPLVYFGDFLIGIGIAGVYELSRREGARHSFGVGRLVTFTACLCVVALISFAKQTPFLVYDTLLRIANGMLVFGLASLHMGQVRRMWYSAAVVGGKASYAMYVLHIPLLWWYKRSAPYQALSPVTAGLVYLALVILLSVFIARWYEGPANVLVRRMLGSAPQTRSS
jgi:peptidoglycan/LPS O-acetylase OafA/YrhL